MAGRFCAVNDKVVNFAEQCVGISEFDVIAWGEDRARTFTDHLLLLHSPKKDAANGQGIYESTFRV